jgi:hypothetical protein
MTAFHATEIENADEVFLLASPGQLRVAIWVYWWPMVTHGDPASPMVKSTIWGIRCCDRFRPVMTCWRVCRRRDREVSKQRVSFALGDTPRAYVRYCWNLLNKIWIKTCEPQLAWVYANFMQIQTPSKCYKLLYTNWTLAGWSLLRVWQTCTRAELTGNFTASFSRLEQQSSTWLWLNIICCITNWMF